MYTYSTIDSDKKLSDLLQSWKQRGITTIAMDFEGEFNLHIYGEHLCLVQVFDGELYYILDPFKVSVPALKQFLEDSDLEKIMFDCASDSALVRKGYDISLANIYDIRVPALALGYTGNLTGLVAMHLGVQDEVPVGNKKKNQMTNWLKRPLKDDQIQYALGDVAYLFSLKKILIALIEEKGLAEQVATTMATIAKPKGPDKPGWTKFDSWKYMNKEEKTYLKHFFIARDTIARKYNVPAVRILEKHRLLEMAKNTPSSASEIHVYCTKCPEGQMEELIKYMLEAKKSADSELKSV
ncbi:HRDC domain-containing protein [Sphaerochaeta sp. PS]|uniref:HRDC domain-containing protein n=1 Tax=Sphaerochaeta sp. PS TaxID=3076336 RepID=UPI0028A436F4|nr:HRDC domain-containing protein [Sphaerochaeta sp. PS]MDT4761071.1 HRDC domain-containing protein [Sphaerochaeta sp. PS]